jgi:hypothetical protein
MLFESAQKVLNLRRGLKMADWTGIRCWLGESSDLAPEAAREVAIIQKMSDTNYRMHEYLSEAMQQNRVGGLWLLSHLGVICLGSYMKLDTSNTNIAALLTALRYASTAPKLSAEDRQVRALFPLPLSLDLTLSIDCLFCGELESCANLHFDGRLLEACSRNGEH